MEYWFYHLEQTTLESALPSLLEKTLEKGWRARVQTGNPDRLGELDSYLWTYRDDSFLPHGRDDQPGADAHPIVLSVKPMQTQEDILFLLDSAEPGPTPGVKRCITMVDSRNPDGADIARARWKSAKARGETVSYWRQNNSGNWQKAE